MNFSGVRLDMSFKEAKELDALLRRDKPLAAIHHKGEFVDYYKCPACGHLLTSNDKYCSKCGQRIDTENVAL